MSNHLSFISEGLWILIFGTHIRRIHEAIVLWKEFMFLFQTNSIDLGFCHIVIHKMSYAAYVGITDIGHCPPLYWSISYFPW